MERCSLEKVTCIAVHIFRNPVHSNIKSFRPTRIEQSRGFLSPFHLSMDTVHNFGRICYRLYKFPGWNLSLLYGTEMVTHGSCSRGYTSFNNIQGPPQNTRHQKPDIKQVSNWGPTSVIGATVQNLVIRVSTTPGTCAPQLTTVFLYLWLEITGQFPDWLRTGQTGIDFWQGQGIWAVSLRPVVIPNQSPVQCVSFSRVRWKKREPDLSSAYLYALPRSERQRNVSTLHAASLLMFN
jgi:hypothetical protein